VPSGALLREVDWASDLVDLLGLEAVLPLPAEPADLFALLCADRAEMALAAGGRRLPADTRFRVAADAPPARGRDGAVRVVLTVPATTLYQLSAEGAGLQRWVIDQQPVGHLDVSALGVAQAPVVVPLREGPHELSAYLAPGARVDRVELTAHRALCVAPADGWREGRLLQYGAMARTLVRAFGVESRLPARDEEELVIEGERFDEVAGGGARTQRRLSNSASGGAWAAALSSPVTFYARSHGVLPQLWSVDDRYRVTLHPDNAEAAFAWSPVLTLPLGAGRHSVSARIARGSGIDAVRAVFHRASDADYVRVLEELGFRGGAAGAPVPRAVAAEALASPTFVDLANAFRLGLEGRHRDRSLVLVEERPAPFRSRPLSPLLPAEL
jgi:hypothetical protein